MMQFQFKADIRFEADDAADAATKIAKHFTMVAAQFKEDDAPEPENWFFGKMEFEPIKE